jgi:L-threonylcarbamoyladenylate synthase
MGNKIFKLHQNDPTSIRKTIFQDMLLETISTLKSGGAIVFPTETLYGLGVDVTNDDAIEHLIELKGRPHNMPISIAVNDIQQLEEFALISDMAERIIENCLPRPITLLLESKPTVNKKLTAGSKLIGFRFPDNEATKSIIKRFGPITATSANLHGSAEPVNIDIVLDQFGEKVDVYIDTGPCKIKKPSTVVDVSDNTIKIIRHGACSGKELENCL